MTSFDGMPPEVCRQNVIIVFSYLVNPPPVGTARRTCSLKLSTGLMLPFMLASLDAVWQRDWRWHCDVTV